MFGAVLLSGSVGLTLDERSDPLHGAHHGREIVAHLASEGGKRWGEDNAGAVKAKRRASLP